MERLEGLEIGKSAIWFSDSISIEFCLVDSRHREMINQAEQLLIGRTDKQGGREY